MALKQGTDLSVPAFSKAFHSDDVSLSPLSPLPSPPSSLMYGSSRPGVSRPLGGGGAALQSFRVSSALRACCCCYGVAWQPAASSQQHSFFRTVALGWLAARPTGAGRPGPVPRHGPAPPANANDPRLKSPWL